MNDNEAAECIGNDRCPAPIHVHGCYTPHRADQCDAPNEFGHLPDAPVTRPDLDTLIAKMKVYAELEDMVGFTIRSTDWLEAADALAAERARADQRVSQTQYKEACRLLRERTGQLAAMESRADHALQLIAEALGILRASSIPLGMTEVMFQDQIITQARRALSTAPTVGHP